ncbi:MAG: tetratricopeptide repeat protein [Candidatus Pseudobacter hemicellulosilyticus]|uniref:Tetratricopeptide repeat protein n=1 Tax=Candidatus Pseudobacter hemicellulosilyticus TaxID=3121375 RepID=A0AAJ6BFJ6_9BACT|nr:MAG: tetratricopeptide repeat protein [Pseudobacter sp.]
MKKITLFFILSGVVHGAIAQQSRFLNDPQGTFKQAKDFFQREQYSLAYPLFKDLQLQQREPDRSNPAIQTQEVNYYTIVCALKQNEGGAVAKARDFIDLEDNAARVQMMSFHLAEYYFRQQDYPNAIGLYEAANIDNLTNREIADMKFHQGYAYFTAKQFDKAKPLFDAIRQMKDDPNYIDANYYYGFLSFNDKKYREALDAFSIVEDHPNYGQVVPYYIANIYYSLGQKDKALEYAENKLKRGNLYYDLEMRQIVGHAYFEKKEFAKALPYLETYVSKSTKVRREDLYELAYCQYQAGQLDKAIDGFKQISGKEDSLAQNAMYLLGDAYLKTGQKTNARNAFLICASNSSNAAQKEISQFNYAKLSFELGYQDVALTELQKFLQAYPQSSYNVEAKELLISVLANTNNYKDALSLLESLQSPSANARRLYPRILYGRATELVNDGMLVGANELLTRAETQPDNASVLPYVQFWKGEVAYRLGKLDDAIRYFNDYLKSSAANGEVNVTNARYNLGYAYLKKENYRQALTNFEQVVSNPVVNASALQQDAWLRSADCYYMNREYKKAQVMYDKVLSFSWPASDYATFQKAMIAGANSGKEKISLLSGLSRKYPGSGLLADANMEIANTYLVDEQFREAIPYLKNVVSDPNSGLKPTAYLKLGIAYYNMDNNAEALNSYTALLKQYPNSTEAADALENARVIYVEQGKSGEYVSFARSMGKEVSGNQEDDLSYEEAEVQFNNGNFPAAAKEFEEYIAAFPQGRHSLEALYYKSEIYYNQKDWVKAAAGYELLADRVPHKYGEKSLLLAARLNFFDLKNYEKAEKYFTRLKDFATSQENKLEAMRGLLRSQYQLQQWTAAMANARELLNQKGIGTDDKVMANMAIAKSQQTAGEYDQAITTYRIAAGLSKAAYGAEARYEIAACQMAQNRMADAEKAAFEVINKSGSYEEWVTKAYILLGDVYFKQKDYFNAKATFQSVVDNAKMEALRQEAETKLKATIEEEKKNSKVE